MKPRQYVGILIILLLALITFGVIFTLKNQEDPDPILHSPSSSPEVSFAATDPAHVDFSPGASIPEPTVPIATPTPNYGGKKLVAITFDDGPYKENTQRLLDGLKERGVPATFMVNGRNWAEISSEINSNLIRRMVAEGHEIGNHTYYHADMKKQSLSDAIRDLNSLNDKVKEIAGGYEMKLFRPPYGSYTKDVLANSNMTMILWSVDSDDYKYLDEKNFVIPYANNNGMSIEQARLKLAKEVADKVIAKAKDGDIILFHDVHTGSTDAALMVVDALREKGFVFLTVSDLILSQRGDIPVGAAFRNMTIMS